MLQPLVVGAFYMLNNNNNLYGGNEHGSYCSNG